MQADRVKITIKGADEPSGLALMLSQYLEQNIRDFAKKNVQAMKIRGTLALEATEGNVGVTLSFKGREIEIADGCASDAKMSVRGGIFSLTELATGGTDALKKVGRGELKLHSAWRHPIFACRVAKFMSLPDEMRSAGTTRLRPLWWKLAIGAGGVAAMMGLAAYLLAR
ncbi:MAG: hypothetical protein JSV16_09420 [Candidatus Hydrogenedentota bacterium]|nr:MAG: hypothetical protein JSV16_09420 [Candidatus Hydrogenedentota bacterium]